MDQDELLDQIEIKNMRIETLEAERKGKTLIGTCRGCQYWKQDNEIFKKWGSCKNLKIDKELNIRPQEIHEKFGCIHWKKKEDDNG